MPAASAASPSTTPRAAASPAAAASSFGPSRATELPADACATDLWRALTARHGLASTQVVPAGGRGGQCAPLWSALTLGLNGDPLGDAATCPVHTHMHAPQRSARPSHSHSTVLCACAVGRGGGDDSGARSGGGGGGGAYAVALRAWPASKLPKGTAQLSPGALAAMAGPSPGRLLAAFRVPSGAHAGQCQGAHWRPATMHTGSGPLSTHAHAEPRLCVCAHACWDGVACVLQT